MRRKYVTSRTIHKGRGAWSFLSPVQYFDRGLAHTYGFISIREPWCRVQLIRRHSIDVCNFVVHDSCRTQLLHKSSKSQGTKMQSTINRFQTANGGRRVFSIPYERLNRNCKQKLDFSAEQDVERIVIAKDSIRGARLAEAIFTRNVGRARPTSYRREDTIWVRYRRPTYSTCVISRTKSSRDCAPSGNWADSNVSTRRSLERVICCLPTHVGCL